MTLEQTDLSCWISTTHWKCKKQTGLSHREKSGWQHSQCRTRSRSKTMSFSRCMNSRVQVIRSLPQPMLSACSSFMIIPDANFTPLSQSSDLVGRKSTWSWVRLTVTRVVSWLMGGGEPCCITCTQAWRHWVPWRMLSAVPFGLRWPT